METKCCASFGGTMSQMMEKRINRIKKKGVLQKSTWVFTPELILCSINFGKRLRLFMRLSIIIVTRSNWLYKNDKNKDLSQVELHVGSSSTMSLIECFISNF